MKAVELREAGYRYGNTEVLRNVTFSIGRGEMLGIVGPNGSGKTTIINLLCGLITPQRGGVSIMGRPLSDYRGSELARIVAVVPQMTEIVFPYTVEEIVAMGRYPYQGWGGWPGKADRRVVGEAMERCGCLVHRDRMVIELSAGERQRVLIARALAQNPAVMLLDEASNFLDIGHELAVFRVLDALRRDQGLTIAAVSHDLNLVGTFCQRVLLLNRGRVHAVGDLESTCTSEALSKLFGADIEVLKREGGGVRVSW